jgi:hypothetical protein
MINAQRGQAVQRAQFNMPYMQNFRYIQSTPVYHQFPQMGYTPFNPGFGFTNYRVVPGLPITPPLPYQPYVQQPRPIVPPAPVYPPAPMMVPHPPVYTAQPLYRAQGNQSNQGRSIVYVQANVPQQPANYNNIKVPNINTAPRNTFQNPQTQVIQLNPQLNNQINMSYNINVPNMGVPPGFVNRGNNRGW